MNPYDMPDNDYYYSTDDLARRAISQRVISNGRVKGTTTSADNDAFGNGVVTANTVVIDYRLIIFIIVILIVIINQLIIVYMLCKVVKYSWKHNS